MEKPTGWDARNVEARNVSGSTAGASSGGFHVYRHQRRRELERLERLEKDAQEREAMEIRSKAIHDLKVRDETKTAKRAAKRQRKKQRKQMAKALQQVQEQPSKVGQSKDEISAVADSSRCHSDENDSKVDEVGENCGVEFSAH